MQTIEELANKLENNLLDLRSFYETILELDKLDLESVPRYVEVLKTFVRGKLTYYDVSTTKHFQKDYSNTTYDLVTDLNRVLELPFGSDLDKKLCYNILRVHNNLSVLYTKNAYSFLKRYGYELKVWVE